MFPSNRWEESFKSPHPPNRMRTFFLRDKILTSCGTRIGRGTGGIAYFCASCGEVWGRVDLGKLDWMAAAIPCGECGKPDYKWGNHLCPGSFLKPLIWWDRINGNTLQQQLNNSDQKLLEYETERHLKWKGLDK